MINLILKNKFSLIGIHLALGYLVTFLPISKLYGLLFFVLSIAIIYSSKNKNEEALYFMSYLVGSEVFMRMTNGAFLYETGKYGIMLFAFMGLLLGPLKQKSTVSFLLYILLLIVGIVFTQTPENESIRKAVVFNLSGPISLGVFAIYCYKRKVTVSQLKDLLFFCVLPIFSMISYVYFRTPNLEELVFGAVSNFDTSGGFGPNQVSTIIGFGCFILAVFLFLGNKLTPYIFIDAIFLIYFIYRGLLTFSRGGMITAAAASVFFAIFMFLHQQVTIIKISKYIFIAVVLFFGIWLYTSNITGGMIDNRYAGKNSLGVKKKDVTAGRGEILKTQIESFYESPIFGIGVGNGKYKRLESDKHVTAASHNEVGRLIEEHGLLGIISLLILILVPLQNAYFSNNYQRAFLFSFYIFWFLTINHTAMRIVFPSFIYGLSLLKIVPDTDES
ncbi:O-antigen ligase domain-containing protein [Polaribacter sp. WD7]|uniref:O-antigen ligase family protein n=1 Tax=Polaribacter sp. WD7 TaxID=2269061 RepID=UPI000DF33FFF|nr:O-antigen ligase family protein [Polaribacter sp. WD7]RCS27053.1 O-antigen ligase domain-containing protein [Polaribacter sp. WD7]